ncbi:MAG: hypothetical protein R3B13_33415 [Polyangiaceae bacterium]
MFVRSSDSTRSTLALVVACALHAVTLGGVAVLHVSAPPARGVDTAKGTPEVDVELNWLEQPTSSPRVDAPNTATARLHNEVLRGPQSVEHAAKVDVERSAEPTGRVGQRAESVAPRRAELVDPDAPRAEHVESSAHQGLPPSAAGRKPARRRVELGLGGSALSGLLLAQRGKDPATRPRPSAGMLAEGLAELDARKGLGRAGAITSAASQAAVSFAPSSGIALIEVHMDAAGSVTRVDVVGSSSTEWSAVARAMAAKLRRRKAVSGKGAGTVMRLRVAVGDHAKAPGAATKRGSALGQGSRPAKDMSRDESTRASFDGPTPSPTLGTTVAGGSNGRAVSITIQSIQLEG